MSALAGIVRAYLRRLRRYAYAARSWVPGLRERHRLEAMVGPLGYWNALRAYQLNLLRANGLHPHHHLLDLGCGPLQGGGAFIRYLEQARYVGVDISPERLSAAYGQVAELGLAEKNPMLLLSDQFGALHLDGRSFDFVWASQVLYYFDDEKLKDLMRMLVGHLAPDGKFLGDIIGPRHPEYGRAQQSAFLSRIKLQTVEGIDALAAPFGLQARGLGEIEAFGYPKRLLLRTNVLVEITRRHALQFG